MAGAVVKVMGVTVWVTVAVTVTTVTVRRGIVKVTVEVRVVLTVEREVIVTVPAGVEWKVVVSVLARVFGPSPIANPVA